MNKKSRRQIAMIDAYKTVFNSEEGQKVLIHLAKTNSLHDPTYDADEKLMALKEGRRCVVLDILHYLEIDTLKLRQQMKKQEELENDEF